MSTGSTDGEKFLDEAENPIPPAEEWDELSQAELMSVLVRLQDKLWYFQSNPALAVPLRAGIAKINALLGLT